MESEKVKEIKKALEEYIRQYSNFKGAELCKEALTLINDLESENKTIKQSAKNLAYVNDKLIERNQELENRVQELENGIAKCMLGCEFLPECTNDKLKQFAERLKEKGQKSFINVGGLTASAKTVTLHDIDETLKEFIGE